MQAIIPQIVYAAWCIFWALANAKAIDRANEHILHGANGLMHLAVCLYFGVELHPLIGAALFFEGRLFFDVFLNAFRMGWRNVGYVPRYPKSIADKLEKSVFGKDGILPKIIYLAIAIALNLIYWKL